MAEAKATAAAEKEQSDTEAAEAASRKSLEVHSVEEQQRALIATRNGSSVDDVC